MQMHAAHTLQLQRIAVSSEDPVAWKCGVAASQEAS